MTPAPFTASLCPPAVRTLLIHAWSEDGVADHELLPVLALTTYPAADGSACIDAVVADQGGYGLVAARHLDSANCAGLIVPAPWDPELDEARLKGAVARVQREAVEAESRSFSARYRPSAAPDPAAVLEPAHA